MLQLIYTSSAPYKWLHSPQSCQQYRVAVYLEWKGGNMLEVFNFFALMHISRAYTQIQKQQYIEPKKFVKQTTYFMLTRMYPTIIANYAMSFNWYLHSNQLTISYLSNMGYSKWKQSSMELVVLNSKWVILCCLQQKNIHSTIKVTFISLTFIES